MAIVTKKIIAIVTGITFLISTAFSGSFAQQNLRNPQPVNVPAIAKALGKDLQTTAKEIDFDFVSNMKVFAQDELPEVMMQATRANLKYLAQLDPQRRKMLVKAFLGYGVGKLGKKLLRKLSKENIIDEQLVREFAEKTPHEKIGWIARSFLGAFLFPDRPWSFMYPNRDTYSSILIELLAYRIRATTELAKRTEKQDSYGERSLHIFDSLSGLPLLDALIGLDAEVVETDPEVVRIAQARIDDYAAHITKADGSVEFYTGEMVKPNNMEHLEKVLQRLGETSIEHITMLNVVRSGYIQKDDVPWLADRLLWAIKNNGTIFVTEIERPYIEEAAKKAGVRLEIFEEGLPTLYTEEFGHVTRFFPEGCGTIFLVSKKDKFLDMPPDSWAAIQLVAGKGTRLESTQDMPKPSRLVAGKPMALYFKELMGQMNIPIVSVIGFGRHKMREILGNDVTYAVQ